MPEQDRGSPELVYRKAMVANGSGVAIELVDTAGILLANHLIEPEEMLVLRLLAVWLRQVQIAFRLKGNSTGGLWGAILSGQRGGSKGWTFPIGANDPSNIGNHAMFKLGQVHDWFTGPQRVLQLNLIMRVAVGETWPGDSGELLELRRGLHEIKELQRHGRR
jgi:hypothetical protein